MLEITAAQTLIARITGIGLASAVFTYYLVKLLVKPFIDVRLESNPYREFAVNAATAVLAVLVSIALQIIAGVFLPAAAPILEALLTAVIAAAVATYGHEAVRNYGNHTTITNTGDDIVIGNIENSSGVAIGNQSSSDVEEHR